MATCTVSGKIVDSTETAVQGATIKFSIVTPYLNSSSNLFVPKEISTTSATDGTFSLGLSQGISGVIYIDYPPNATDSVRRYTFSVVIPATATATLSSLITEA